MEKKNDVSLLISQKSAISQSLRYSLTILEMNNLELLDHANDALNDNPFLKDDGYKDKFVFYNDMQFLENIAAERSMKDDIISQMPFLHLNDEQKEVAFLLTDHIIENRYLSNEILIDISKERNIAYFDLLIIIKKLQTLSPHGLFAFNLKDKLKSALEARDAYDDDCRVFIQNFDLVLDNGILILQTRCGLSDSSIANIISKINSVDFNFDYQSDNSSHCIPDIIIDGKICDGYEPSMNDSSLPNLSVDKELYERFISKNLEKNDKKYMKEKVAAAQLLVKSVNYRASTLLKIAREIIYRQYDFFSGNNDCMYPIDVKTVANILMLHESTVHRAIANKNISTPRGMFDLKSLMPKKVKSDIEENFASDHSVKEYIKDLINNEPKHSPYSDNHIMHFLNSRGVNISRRTTSKYRSILNIPNASQRCKYYKLRQVI
jgi:RNA polymerase sigma-54 factor